MLLVSRLVQCFREVDRRQRAFYRGLFTGVDEALRRLGRGAVPSGLAVTCGLKCGRYRADQRPCWPAYY